MYLFGLIIPTLIGTLIFAGGLGLGLAVLRPWRTRLHGTPGAHCLAAGLGMAIIAHVLLVLGLAGLWQPAGMVVIALVLAALAAVGFLGRKSHSQDDQGPQPNSKRKIQNEKRTTDNGQPTTEQKDVPARGSRGNPVREVRLYGLAVQKGERSGFRPTAVEVLLLLALAVVTACLGLRATLPPANYDVLEYHLGAVRHWLREGRIFAFPHLFYAALPFEVEMWYAAGCFFEGNALLPLSPKLINFGLLLCNMATVYALASMLCRERTLRLLACLLFAIHAQTTIAAYDALNDLGLTWFAALAVLAWLLWLTRGERLYLALWAVMLGLAVCCKYTAIGLIVLPAALCLAPVAAVSAARGQSPADNDEFVGCQWDGRRTVGRLAGVWALLPAVGVAVFLPWAIKNALHFGNPVYPLLSGIFPSPTWSPQQTQFYLEAHGRTGPLHAAYWWALGRNVGWLGPWLVGAAVGGCFVGGGRVVAAALMGAVAAGLAVHSVFPDNPARFMLPFVPILAVLAVRLVERLRQRVVRAALVGGFAAWCGLGVVTAINPVIADGPARAFVRMGLPVYAQGVPVQNLIANLFLPTPRLSIQAQALGLPVVESQRFVNERTPPESRVFLLYEARMGCFDRPLEVGSVFDRSPLLERAAGAKSGQELIERLRREGFEYVYVNEFELARLVRTYAPRQPYKQRLEQLGKPDVRTVDLWLDLYPPFWLDERFRGHERVVREFLAICRRRAVYSASGAGPPFGLWIARLGE